MHCPKLRKAIGSLYNFTLSILLLPFIILLVVSIRRAQREAKRKWKYWKLPAREEEL